MDHAPSSPNNTVPTPVVAERHAGWRAFTRFVVISCAAVAGLLVLLLLIFKVF